MINEFPIVPRAWSPDDFIVTQVTVLGFEVPRFGDLKWNLACLFARPNVEPPVLDFSGLLPWQMQTAKELMAARLDEFHVSSRRSRLMWPYKPATCDVMLVRLRKLYAFMAAEGLERLADITQAHLNKHLLALKADFPKPSQRMTIVNDLLIYVWLYESAGYLSGGGLRFDPWEGEPLTKVANWSMPDETVTPVIPRDVLATLLPWALAYVDHFGKDIIAVDRGLFEGMIGPPDLRQGSAERFRRYCDQLEAGGAGLPAYERNRNIYVALDYIQRGANVSWEWLDGAGKGELKWALQRLPLEVRHLPGWTHVPEGCLGAFRTGVSVREAKRECVFLTTACYVVVAYLSGMRDSEIQDLRRGCSHVSYDAHGYPERFKVKGRVFKGRGQPTPEDWVVIDPVMRAIAILEELTAPYYAKTGDDHLFVYHRGVPRVPAVIRGHINKLLNKFAEHCSKALAPLVAAQLDPAFCEEDRTTPQLRAIADQPDGPWRFTTSQFRKTLARFIAREPFGVIAGAIQYKHASLKMFEGYAGHPESGFPEEVAVEELEARLSDMAAMYVDATNGIRPVGPMAGELLTEFESLVPEIGPFPGTVASDKRLKELLRHRAAKMRAGILSHCFFEPSEARCLSHLDLPARAEPVTGLCRSDCKCACVTRAHRPMYERLANEAQTWARTNRISALAREVYLRDRDSALAMVAKIDKACGGQGA